MIRTGFDNFPETAGRIIVDDTRAGYVAARIDPHLNAKIKRASRRMKMLVRKGRRY